MTQSIIFILWHRFCVIVILFIMRKRLKSGLRTTMSISVYFFSRATAQNLILTKSSIRMSKAMPWGKKRPHNLKELLANVRGYLRGGQRQPHIVKKYFQEKHVRSLLQMHIVLRTHLPTTDGNMVHLRYCSIPKPKQGRYIVHWGLPLFH